MVYILLAAGFEEIEALTPCDLLRRAGVEVALVGVKDNVVVGSHRIAVQADLTLNEVCLDKMDMLVLPGGLRGVQGLLESEEALKLTKSAWEAGKYVCAICAGPTILAKLGIIGSQRATCYPGKEPEMGCAQLEPVPVVESGRLITGRAAGCSVPFALALIKALKGSQEAERIASQIVWNC